MLAVATGFNYFLLFTIPVILSLSLNKLSVSSYMLAATSLNQLHTPSSPLLSRSLSAPSTLDQSTTVQEGIHDVRRLQRWRANVQKKHSRCSAEDQTDCDVNVRTFVSTVAEIFSFIGSDPDKAVSSHIRIKGRAPVANWILVTIWQWTFLQLTVTWYKIRYVWDNPQKSSLSGRDCLFSSCKGPIR